MCLGSNRNMWQYTQEDISASTFSNKPQQYISITPITALGCQQCLPLSVVQLKVKHCRKPYCRNGVVDTFRLTLLLHSKVNNINSLHWLKFLAIEWISDDGNFGPGSNPISDSEKCYKLNYTNTIRRVSM